MESSVWRVVEAFRGKLLEKSQLRIARFVQEWIVWPELYINGDRAEKKRSDANSILLNLFSLQSPLQKSAMLTIESTLSKARKKAGGVHTTLQIGKSTFCVQHRCSHTGAEIVPFNHSVYGTNTNPPSRVSKFLSSEPDSTILSSLAV